MSATRVVGSLPQRGEPLDVFRATEALEALISNDSSHSPLLKRRGLAPMPAKLPPTAPPAYPPPPTPLPSSSNLRNSFHSASRKPVRSSPLAGPAVLSLNDSTVSLHDSSPPSPVERVSSSPNLTPTPSLQPQSIYAKRPRSSQGLADTPPSATLRKSFSSGRVTFLGVPSQGGVRPDRSSDEISISSSQSSALHVQLHRPRVASVEFTPTPSVPESISRATSQDSDKSGKDNERGKHVLNSPRPKSSESLRSTGGTQDNWLTANPYEATPRFSRLGLGADGVVLPVSAKHYRSNSDKSLSRSSSRTSISSRLAHRPSLSFSLFQSTATTPEEEDVKPPLPSPSDSSHASSTTPSTSSSRASTATSRTSSSESITSPPKTDGDTIEQPSVPDGSQTPTRRNSVQLDDTHPQTAMPEGRLEKHDSNNANTTTTAPPPTLPQPSLSSRLAPLIRSVRSRAKSFGGKSTISPRNVDSDSKSRVSSESTAATLTPTATSSIEANFNPERPPMPGWGLVSFRPVTRKLRRPQTANPLSPLPAQRVPPLPVSLSASDSKAPAPAAASTSPTTPEVTTPLPPPPSPVKNSKIFPRTSTSSRRRPSTSQGAFKRRSFLSFGSLSISGRASSDIGHETYSSSLPFTLTVNTHVHRSGVADQVIPDSPTVLGRGSGAFVRRAADQGVIQEDKEKEEEGMDGNEEKGEKEGKESVDVDEFGARVTVAVDDQKSAKSLKSTKSSGVAGNKVKKEGTVRRFWKNLTSGGLKKQLQT
ncbi:hypothetical protein AX16_006778 [Volvariella volvacea WC 439]|nr:hypothetical protein AX16_006778 [Volvariella volvacea WC 439]